MKYITTIVLFLLYLPPLTAIATKYEEIIVTAQIREQTLLDTSFSISVIDSHQIAQHKRLNDIATQIPSMQTVAPNGGALPIFSIRGVSMADYNVNQSSPIAIYLDNTHLSANYTHGLALFDLERIEVLRGPQGTLYGKNTTGGAINIISKTPDFTADGYLITTAGNFNHRAINAAYETPLIDQLLAARLAIAIDKADGFSSNHVPSHANLSTSDQQATRVTLKLTPTDVLTATLKLSYSYNTPKTYAVIPIATNAGGINHLSTLLKSRGEPFYKRPQHYDSFDADANLVDETQTRTRGASLLVNWTLLSTRLQSVSSYYKGNYEHNADSDGTAQQSLESFYNSQIRQWNQDINLSSLNTEPFAYTIGAYFSQETLDVFNLQEFFHGKELILPGFDPFNPDFSQSTGFSLGQFYKQHKKSNAFYGQFNYLLTQRLTLTTGLRYTEDAVSQFDINTYVADYSNQPQIGLIPFSMPYDAQAVYPEQQFIDHETTGTLKLAYAFDNNNLFYLSYSHGYRSGAFNGAAILTSEELSPVNPEYINAYEIGAKGTLWNQQLEYASAVFYYDYRNQQFINIVDIQQLLDSANRSRVQGLEIELQAWPAQAFNMQLGLGFLDTQYTDGPVLQQRDLSGNQLIAAPKVNANLGINYRLNVYHHGYLDIHADINYRSKHWFSAFNNKAGFEEIGQSGYSLINTRLQYRSNQQPWSVSLWGRNLANKQYKTYAINLRDGFGYHYSVVGAPRMYGIDIEIEF